MISYVLDIHFAFADTKTAVGAFGSFELYAEQREFVEEPIQSTERTDKAAENSKDEHGADDNADRDSEFPGKERSKSRKLALVDLVGKKSKCALNSACGTDVLTEAGKRYVAKSVKYGNYHYEKYQNHVLEVRENLRYAVLLQLRETLDLIEKNYASEYRESGYFAAICKGTLFSYSVDGKEAGKIIL